MRYTRTYVDSSLASGLTIPTLHTRTAMMHSFRHYGPCSTTLRYRYQSVCRLSYFGSWAFYLVRFTWQFSSTGRQDNARSINVGSVGSQLSNKPPQTTPNQHIYWQRQPAVVPPVNRAGTSPQARQQLLSRSTGTFRSSSETSSKARAVQCYTTATNATRLRRLHRLWTPYMQ
jgi:hypothetical protein